MTLTILRYNNRKLYIPQNVNIALKGIVKLGRYVTLPEIRKLISENKDIIIKVTNSKGINITKNTLYNCLLPSLFTLGDLYNLVREQAQCQSVLNSYESETAFYRNGIEL
tara:strand:+ start:365 stop:694 length:330 start_codon:yes stop_codon:yes gene_type:complete